MSLTPAQLTALRTAIDVNPTWAAYPLSLDGYFDLARRLNGLAVPNFWVWSTTADVGKVRAAVVWANLTPQDVPDTTQQWANRSLQCQGKQFNLQMMIPFSGTIDGSDSTFRAGLQDALQGVRSGAAGAVQDAGWAAVRNALARRAKWCEMYLADSTNGTGATRATAATMVFEGDVQPLDVELARGL
jgi:hypothetical protein